MEDLNQSNHALDISEMSGIHLDPAELKKQSKKKSKPGTTDDDNQVKDVYEKLAAQPRKSVTKEQHEGLTKAILKDLSRLRGYVNEDFKGDKLDRYKDLVGQLTLLIAELAKSDLKTAINK